MGYWEDRTLNLLMQGEKSAQQLLDELKDVHTSTRRDIFKEVELLYAELLAAQEKSGVQPTVFLEQGVGKAKLPALKLLLAKFKKEADKLGLSNEYKNRLHVLSLRKKITRLEELDIHIQHMVEVMHNKYESQLEGHLMDTYANSYYTTAYNGAIYTGIGTNLNKFSESQLHAVVNSQWLERDFKKSVWNDRKELIKNLKVAVRKMTLQGNTLETVSKGLAKSMRTSYTNAERLVVTETTKICNDALADCYTNILGVERYEFLATLDFKTSEVCRGLDGKNFALADAQISVNRPPMHPYCRSVIKPYLEDKVVDMTTRIARDSKGNTTYVPADTTYDTWFNRYVG